jgi:hypothetical protein
VNILTGSLRPELGPLPCISCGRIVIFGVAVHLIEGHAGYGKGYDVDSPVRRRGLYDKSTEAPHQCRAIRARAA